MDELELQLEDNGAPEMPQEEHDMSDDDIASSLGFMTTLSEQMMSPGQEDDLQEGGEPTEEQETSEQLEEEQGAIEGDTDGTPKKDAEQDKEIADIKAQLEQLLAQENGTETENTGTTFEA